MAANRRLVEKLIGALSAPDDGGNGRARAARIDGDLEAKAIEAWRALGRRGNPGLTAAAARDSVEHAAGVEVLRGAALNTFVEEQTAALWGVPDWIGRVSRVLNCRP